MLFKIITITTLVYILYRISSMPTLLGGKSDRSKKNTDDSEYVDYEEVE